MNHQKESHNGVIGSIAIRAPPSRFIFAKLDEMIISDLHEKGLLDGVDPVLRLRLIQATLAFCHKINIPQIFVVTDLYLLSYLMRLIIEGLIYVVINLLLQ